MLLLFSRDPATRHEIDFFIDVAEILQKFFFSESILFFLIEYLFNLLKGIFSVTDRAIRGTHHQN